MHTPSITSVTNSRVKTWIALGKRSERDESGSFLVEGLRESERIGELTPILETIWCEAYAHVDAPRNAVTVSQHVFDRISRRTNPDGVAVIAKTPYLGIDTFSPPSPVLTVVADGIEKPGNIGAMLRTCDALGAAFIASELGTDVRRIALDADERYLLASDALANRLHLIDVAAWRRVATLETPPRPFGIVFDEERNLFWVAIFEGAELVAVWRGVRSPVPRGRDHGANESPDPRSAG